MPRLLIAFALVAASLPAANAFKVHASRRQCQATCAAKIEHDCGALRRRRLHACRKKILGRCRRVSIESCFLTPPTETTSTSTSTTVTTATSSTVTTTSSSPVPTTLASTTTTVVLPTTTTTTLFSYGGDWFFSGTPTLDSCNTGATALVGVDVTVAHGPDAATLTVQLGIAPTLAGTASAAGFDADESHVDSDGCLVTTALVAEPTSDPSRMDAGLGLDATCGTDTCRIVWIGALTR